MSQYLVYGLVDPRDNELRYVGLSTRGMRRPKEHLSADGRKGNRWVCRWLRVLHTAGLSPYILILRFCATPEETKTQERSLISLFKLAEFPLTNLTDGGDGTLGLKQSPKVKEALRLANTGRKQPAEERLRRAIACTGVKRSPAFCDKLRRLKTGLVHTDETKAKISRARTGSFKLSPEHKEKLRIANTGRKHTAAWKARMRELNLGKTHKPEVLEKLKGRACSSETRERMRRSALARPPVSQETRAKQARISAARRHTPGEIEKIRAANIGRKHTPETIAKMRVIAQRRALCKEEAFR